MASKFFAGLVESIVQLALLSSAFSEPNLESQNYSKKDFHTTQKPVHKALVLDLLTWLHNLGLDMCGQHQAVSLTV